MKISKITQKIIIFLSLISLTVACTINGNDRPPEVRLMGVIIGEQQERLEKALEPFEQETGINVVYEGTDAFATLLPIRVDGGNPPDIAMFPQPGLMRDFAREGELIPLETFMSVDNLIDVYGEDWVSLGELDGNLYGLWYRASVKSLVWYPPQSFAEHGYSIPQTWDEMIVLSDQIVAEGKRPWCLGIESGDATGWVGTDWVEDILLRSVGAEEYDQWVDNEIPFNDPRVKEAFEKFGAIALNEEYVRGGRVGVLSTPFGDSINPMFEDPPRCYLHRQANFIDSFFPSDVTVGEDVAFFPLPPINPEQGQPILVAGDAFAMFNDTPEARQLMEYLASSVPHEVWASLGGFISPQREVSLDVYPDELTRQVAELLLSADVVRFDGSDMMPGAVGTGTFWTGVVDYLGGADLEGVLDYIENSFPEL
ncbi:extracellular solute-binding protein family 1 [Cyanobacterium stanieri PCC 7202]|uniref:Extracellular solute-binding protein family 1 n=1 Tax=Cyanobacterium stanieri (strain ATCC 29140 / PCC 7202) TaxID=292563 RepID=K9YKJ1_CYASC|nr:extracellular solute-binding protein family 1 [Cyanobacterium stanieri PCC 7202]